MHLKDFLVKQYRDWQDPDREENPTSCPEISIEQVPEALHDKLMSEAAAAGAIFLGTSVSFDHCWFEWNYDGPSETLHITCTKKPFFIDCETVEQRIRDLVKSAKDVVG